MKPHAVTNNNKDRLTHYLYRGAITHVMYRGNTNTAYRTIFGTKHYIGCKLFTYFEYIFREMYKFKKSKSKV